MSLSQSRPTEAHQLADHSADRRMLMLAAMALVVGTGGAFGAWLLLKLIAVATNLFWFGRFSTDSVDIADTRSEEHTSELQSLMRISYAVFCLKKKKNITKHKRTVRTH